jgi:hypothetical protein
MGVDRSDYMIYGYKLPENYFESKGIEIFEGNKYMPFIEGWKGEDYSIVHDQMCGKYCVFGYSITHANNQGFKFVELPTDGWPVTAEQVKAKFNEVFGFTDDELGEPKVFIFTHYW